MSDERRGWGPREGEVLPIVAPTGTHLQNLALQANDAHNKRYHAWEQTKMSLGRTLEYAVDAGRALAEMRQNVKHGEWLPLLGKHCPNISQQDASAYLHLYEASASGALDQITDVRDLSMHAVLKQLGPANAAPGRATKDVKKATILTVGRTLGKAVRSISKYPELQGEQGGERRRKAIRAYLQTLKGGLRETMEREFIEWGTAMLDELGDADSDEPAEATSDQGGFLQAVNRFVRR